LGPGRLEPFGYAASLVVFLVLEHRQQKPMLDLGLFRSATFVGATLTVLLSTLAMFGVLFYVSLYMQNVLGFSPIEAGAAFLPLTLLIILIAPIAGRRSDRVGSRWLLVSGTLLLAAQLFYFSRLSAEESYWALVPGMLLGGVGIALIMSPSTAAALSGVSVDKAGVGSAVVNTARQLGGSIGIALMGAILAHEVAGRTTPEEYVHGLSVALVVASGIALAGAVVAGVLVRSHVEVEHDAASDAAATPAPDEEPRQLRPAERRDRAAA
jgi:predicted MFS family arabinose efflux permease